VIDLIEEVIVSGLILGGLYALLSLGFSLIVGVARILNFAHGALYMLTAYFIISFLFLGLGPAIIISLVLIVLVTLIIYRLLIGPMREKGAEAALVTIALALVFQETVKLIWGSEMKSVPYLISGYVTMLGVRVVSQKLLALVAAAVLVSVLWYFIMRTKLGKGIRAVAQNMEVARLVGINVRRVFIISMGISGLLAGFAAVFFAPLTVVSPTEWSILFSVFPVLVLGGLGNLKGSFVASFVIAFIEKIIEFYIAGGYAAEVVSFVIMGIILLVRPTGIFGKSNSGGGASL
jgi:branched-chain amino acid transport system permease protein